MNNKYWLLIITYMGSRNTSQAPVAAAAVVAVTVTGAGGAGAAGAGCCCGSWSDVEVAWLRLARKTNESS